MDLGENFLDAVALRKAFEFKGDDNESLIDAHALMKKNSESLEQMQMSEIQEDEEYKPTSDCFGEITCKDIFNRQVRYLNALEKRYKEIQSEAKELRPIINDLKTRVSMFMKGPLSEERKEPVVKVNIKDANIRYNLKQTRRTISSFSKKELPTSLTRYFVEIEKVPDDQATKKAESFMEFCKSICKKVEKTVLTRKEL